MAAPSHPAAELMELCEAEPLGVFNDHDHRIGDIHPHLDDGGGNEHLDPARRKIPHHGVLLSCFQPAVEQAKGVGTQRSRHELFKIRRRRGEIGLPILDQGTHDIGLPALIEVPADIGVRSFPLVTAHGECGHRLAAGGQLV